MDCQAHGDRSESTTVNLGGPGDDNSIHSSLNTHSSHDFNSGTEELHTSSSSTATTSSGGSAHGSSIKECDPSLAAAHAQPNGRAVAGTSNNSRLATRMHTFLADSASPSGYEEGADGVEVFQNVTHSIGTSMFGWVSSCQPSACFQTCWLCTHRPCPPPPRLGHSLVPSPAPGSSKCYSNSSSAPSNSKPKPNKRPK